MARRTNENLLISAILNSGDANLAKDYGVRIEHFNGYSEEYNWILTQHSQFGRCPTVGEFLAHYPHFAAVYDNELASGDIASAHLMMEHAQRELRGTISHATMLLEKGYVADAFEAIEKVRMPVAAAKPVNALVDHTYLDDYSAPHERRIQMPWESLNKYTQGIGGGELWYFAARQGHGKSSFLIDMACEAALYGFNVALYSLEMTRRQTQVRMHAALGRRLGIKVDARAMLHRSYSSVDYKHLLERIADEVPGTVSIHEVSMGIVTPATINAHAGDFDMSIVDYVGLMRNDEGVPAIKDYRIIAEISNSLKSIALGRKHTIIAASQINRDGVTVGWRPPALHTLAQSDHLGNDGDVVITMKRFGRGSAVCSVEKNRHGQSDVCFWTRYDANAGDFREITRDEAEAIKMEDEEE